MNRTEEEFIGYFTRRGWEGREGSVVGVGKTPIFLHDAFREVLLECNGWYSESNLSMGP